MPDIVEDLEGIELVGEGADAVLIGGPNEDLRDRTRSSAT
jgi:hypothetical protein